MSKKRCDDCKYQYCEANAGHFIYRCGNSDSFMAGSVTEYDDYCDKWEKEE